MFRCAAQRLFVECRGTKALDPRPTRLPSCIIDGPRFSTRPSSALPSDNPSSSLLQRTQILSNRSSSTSSSSSSCTSSSPLSPDGDARPSWSQESGERGGGERKTNYHDEAARVLQASLHHVPLLGWSESAMIAGAKDVGVSPSIVGSFPRKEAALVEFFMDECLQKLIDRMERDEEIRQMMGSDCMSKAVRIRLEMQGPYISKWPQALSIQAKPANFPVSLKQRGKVVDEIWHAVGDDASDIDWYLNRTVVGGIYSTTEVYMLSDSSPDFRDTWEFLEDRIKDAVDLKNTFQEAMYAAETVGAGMGKAFQGFLKNVPRG